MDESDRIKAKIERLYNTDPHVHVGARMPRSFSIPKGTPARIIGVYRHIFQVEASIKGYAERFSFQYGDVLIGHVEISELDAFQKTKAVKSK